MSAEDSGPGRWRVVAAVLTGSSLLYLGWLAVSAFEPDVAERAPAWLGWLSDSRSPWSITFGLVLAAAAFGSLLVSRKLATLRIPFLLSVWCAGGAVPLAMAAYLPCTGDSPPFWTAVSSTLALFLGSYETPFGPGQACAYPVPLGLQLARLLAIFATLSGAASVLFAVSRSQLDRFGLIRARSLTAFVDVDATALPLLQRLARPRGRGGRTVLLTAGADEYADAARLAGALVLRTDLKDPLGLREQMPWGKVDACYLLSPDAAANRSRALELRRLLTVPDGSRRAGRVRLVARIDDPWHADDWRKRFIGDAHVVVDAVSTFEATAARLVAQLAAEPRPTHLVLTGDAPLVLGVCAELSQHGREARFVDGTAPLPDVVVLDPGATELVADHRLRQSRFVTDPLPLRAVDAAATLGAVEAELARLGVTDHDAAVVIATPGTRLGSRLALRHPDLLVYEVAGEPGASDVAESPVGRLHTFSLGLSDADGRTSDAWERAAQALHERYRRRFPDARLSMPWAELPDEVYRESNRRQLHSVLDAVAALGRTWAPTVPEPGGADEVDGPPAAGSADRVAEGMARFGLSEAELGRVAEREHESWQALFRSHGWQYGPERDERARRHPLLRPWAELDDDARLKTTAGVVDTLFALRALGYRAVPRSEAGGWTSFERVGEVTATRLTAPHPWRTPDGDDLVGQPGDWLVRDEAGGARTVTDGSFRATHEHLTGDRWRRAGTVRARRAVPGEEVRTQEGPSVAGTDSWLAEDAEGNRWLLPDAQLRAGYRPASQA